MAVTGTSGEGRLFVPRFTVPIYSPIRGERCYRDCVDLEHRSEVFGRRQAIAGDSASPELVIAAIYGKALRITDFSSTYSDPIGQPAWRPSTEPG
jgi:hypothetical protein